MEMIQSSVRWMSILMIGVLLWPVGLWAATEEPAPGRVMAQQAVKEKQLWITADHTKHKALQQEFSDRKSTRLNSSH